MFRTNSRRTAAITAATALVALVAACSDTGAQGTSGEPTPTPAASASAPPDTGYNPQDVAFATNMIGHHHQAVMMASIAAERNARPEVRALAAQIQQAQEPEIVVMSGWLMRWGKPVPGDGMSHGAGPAMPGMMSAERMDELNESTGTKFDTLFLTMMIEHHKGAIVMATAEQKHGKNTKAKKLAARTVTDQGAEIATMTTLLAGK